MRDTHRGCNRQVLGASSGIHLLTSAKVSLLGSLGATSLVMKRQALWLEAIERRISATTAMLNSMKGVKMCGLTDVLRDDLQQLRVDEMDISKKFRKLLIWTMFFCEQPWNPTQTHH
jgi:ATP-binding cassette subfamily C (CFTR/MRP) protein 1